MRHRNNLLLLTYMVTTKVQFGFANTYSSFIFYAKCKEYSAFQMSEFRSEHEGCGGGGARRQKTLDSFLQSQGASKDAKKSVFECPICGGAVEALSEIAFNAHLDRCLKEQHGQEHGGEISQKCDQNLKNGEHFKRDKSGGKSSPSSSHHVLCPVCQERIAARSDDDVSVNRHVDECLSRQLLKSEKRAADNIDRDRDKPPPSKRAKSGVGVRGIESYLTKKGLGSR